MATKLTKKQKTFVEAYVETGNGTQSALKAYDTDKPTVANAIAVENLQKPSIQEYLQSKAEVAAEIVFQIAQFGESDDVKLKASKDILDRAGYKAIEKHMTLNITPEVSDKVKDLAKKFNQ